MLETYLFLESIARQFKEVVLETKIIKLSSHASSVKSNIVIEHGLHG